MVSSRPVIRTSAVFALWLALTSLKPATVAGQTASDPQPPATSAQSSQPPIGRPAPDPTATVVDKRIFGVLPNYRTAEQTSTYHPISAHYKMKIALKDSFDYPLFGVAAAYAGLYQLEDNHPQFGQGAKGYFSRLGTSYTDQIVGNMLTEGVLPIAFHEDPRYFRRAEGTKAHRTLYALSRIFVTHTDSGATTFNFAEVLGNGIASGVGLSYYSDDRDVQDFMLNWGTQLATDATSQVLKEFWPDVKHWWKNRHNRATAQAQP